MSTPITVTVEIVREGGDRVAARGRVTSAEMAEGSTAAHAPVWYEAANRAAAKALRGCGAEVWGRTFAFAGLTAPQVVDRAGDYYQATAVDSRGAVMGRAMISVR
jgi:hypothetical protein